VEDTFDVFEKLRDGSLIWRCSVSGQEEAIVALKKLATETSNEVRAMHLATKTVIATLNSGTS
jgi:hypothetical protein